MGDHTIICLSEVAPRAVGSELGSNDERWMSMKESACAVACIAAWLFVLSLLVWTASAWGQVAGLEVYQALEGGVKVRVVIALRPPTIPPIELQSMVAEIAAMQ